MLNADLMKSLLLILLALLIGGCEKRIHEARLPGHSQSSLILQSTFNAPAQGGHSSLFPV